MRSLLKKKSEAVEPLMPHWHPDFRNYERLPDIKVVRTAFFVNGVAISVLLALLIMLSMREWQVHVVNRQIDDWQRQIDRDKRGSEQDVALYKKFQAEEARVVEVNTFVKSKPVVSELLFHLGATLPKNLALDSFDVRANGLGLRGTVRGAPDQATGYASAYIEQLKNDPFVAARFEDVALKGLTRNPGNNRVVIELFLKARPTPLKEVKKP
jgi:hypothetical protein